MNNNDHDLVTSSISIFALIFITIILGSVFAAIESSKIKKAVNEGEYVEEYYEVKDVEFQKKHSRIIAFVETKDDFLMFHTEYNKNDEPILKFKASKKAENEIKLSKYIYKGKEWGPENIIYINEKSIKEIKKNYFKMSGKELEVLK